jgi:hypothetical protein
VDNFTKLFSTWMDEHGLTARTVAHELNAEEQTIRNWRSQGVPKRRQPHVELFMKEWDSRQGNAPAPLGQNLVLRPSEDQWTAWEEAALAAGEKVTDWAINGLNQLAAEAFEDLAEPESAPATPTKKAS